MKTLLPPRDVRVPTQLAREPGPIRTTAGQRPAALEPGTAGAAASVQGMPRKLQRRGPRRVDTGTPGSL